MKTLLLFATLLSTLLSTCHGGYFWIKGTKLMDANNVEFIPRGINTANADNDYGNRPSTYYDAIAKTNANCIRIQWRIESEMSSKGLSDQNLYEAIQMAIDKHMIPIVELWTYTGDKPYGRVSKDDMVAAGQWWAKRIPEFKKRGFEDKLLINIANEWSTFYEGKPESKVWIEAYSASNGPIKQIRNAQWKGTLIVDSAAYAQSPDTLLTYAKQLMGVDGNLLFSLHLYADWRKNAVSGVTRYDKSKLDEIVNKGIPLMIGEFADQHPESSNRGCQLVQIGADDIMNKANALGIGYLGWSWKGNGKDDCGNVMSYLDVAKTWNCMDPNSCFTDWGKKLLGGLKSAKKATVFPTSG